MKQASVARILIDNMNYCGVGIDNVVDGYREIQLNLS